MEVFFVFTGIIKLKNNGDFFIANEGRRPIYIDGRPVLSGNKWKLNNNSVVEVNMKLFLKCCSLGLKQDANKPHCVSSDRRSSLCFSHQLGTHLINKSWSGQDDTAVNVRIQAYKRIHTEGEDQPVVLCGATTNNWSCS